MECCMCDLSAWLSCNDSRDIARAAIWLRHIVNGIAYFHDSGIIHRDLKPSNIRIDKNGRVKICDFGIITIIENSDTEDITRTPLYMAPELISLYNSKVDIFSIGLIFIELCALMNNELRRAVFDDIRKGKNEMLYALFENQQKVAHFVKWLTSANPAERPTAQQILDHDFLS
ncbi:hypothetical protein PRIPAC_90543 [Pristionchus pacificus]|uniref:Protein kinase domain-containing protein n=1 Tax=Pristionchus pacificus TaxID=54126 RepID=A0A2A6CXG5_PRIPA|nr:hypothetical protein PRIPAC_90543 [Pristionchus pacificus]|eukprot:PDM82924.1 protein kinase [Pristionchus pacificus]